VAAAPQPAPAPGGGDVDVYVDPCMPPLGIPHGARFLHHGFCLQP
jgi:hypothetical protein